MCDQHWVKKKDRNQARGVKLINILNTIASLRRQLLQALIKQKEDDLGVILQLANTSLHQVC